MTSNLPVKKVLSLYRTYLRQVRLLPHSYLRLFFSIKARDDITHVLSTRKGDLGNLRLVFASSNIRQLGEANRGGFKAFDCILDLAYGREGKLRTELMERILADQALQKSSTTATGVENFWPPVYPPALRALLLSPHSRTTKPLKPISLLHPPTLPARADPSSEEARILGRLSKRREINSRRNYFIRECKKIRPPIEVHDESFSPFQASTMSQDALHPFAIGTEGNGLLLQAEAVVGSLCAPAPITRRERLSIPVNQDSKQLNQRHPSRWLRRRYQSLLSRVPKLVAKPRKKGGDSPSFVVDLSPLSTPPYHRPLRAMPEADPITLAWVRYSTSQLIQPT